MFWPGYLRRQIVAGKSTCSFYHGTFPGAPESQKTEIVPDDLRVKTGHGPCALFGPLDLVAVAPYDDRFVPRVIACIPRLYRLEMQAVPFTGMAQAVLANRRCPCNECGSLAVVRI